MNNKYKKILNPFISSLQYVLNDDNIDVYKNEQYIKDSLANGKIWDISHSEDNDFKRIIQIFHQTTQLENSLDFDLGDENLFVQENEDKTEFTNQGELQLQFSPWASTYAGWHLNESSGNIAYDFSDNERNAITVNNPLWIEGKLNNCLQFNGINQYVNCGDIANFDYDESFSLECWFKTKSKNQIILSRMDNNLVRGWQLVLHKSTSIYFGLYHTTVPTNALVVYTDSTGWNDDEWHHIIMTYDGTNSPSGICIYIDREKQSLITYGNTLTSSIKNPANCQISGRDGDTLLWKGNIDETIIYDKTLTVDEVANRWNSGQGIELTGYDISQGWYVHTNENQIDTSLWKNIINIGFTETKPTETEIRYYISTDNRNTWKYWDNDHWKSENNLDNIDILGNSSSELESLNENNWIDIGLTDTFDIAMSLKTINAENTPSLSQIDIAYRFPGKIKCKDSQIRIELISPTLTRITNISGVLTSPLTDLRANILIEKKL